MVEPVIEMRDVSFSAQNVEIVRNVSLKVEEGKTLALVGPSGGGKSTVLKLAAGLLVPTGGTIFFRGKNIAAMSRSQNLDFRREEAVVFQDSALWSNQNLYQCLELPLKIHFPKMNHSDCERRIKEALNEVGYKKETHIRPAMLSAGEQKLIAFARAMICKPELLFLDEWTESLDDTAARRLVSLVKRQQEEQRTIVLVSHDFGLIRSLADYVVMIMGGQLSLKLTKDQIAENENLSQMIEKSIAS